MLKKLNFVFILIALGLAAAGLQAQTLASDQTSLTFSAQAAGQPSQQSVNISASNGTAVFFIASTSEQTAPGTQWLKVSDSSNPTPAPGTTGTTPQALTITADPTGLSAGNYTGQVVISTPAGGNTVTISVTFTVSAIGVSPSSLSFSYQIGGTVPNGQSITLTGVPTNYTATASTASGVNWLQVAPASGASPGAVTALLDPTITPTLAAGTYKGTVTITPTGTANNTPVTVPVTLTVAAAPTVTVGASGVQLNFQIGGANNQVQQSITLSTNSAQPVNFSIAATVANNPAGRNWIVVNPSSGVIPANGSTTVTVTYDTTANLPAGTWTGSITVFTSGTAQTQQTVPVNLLVSNQPLLSVPVSALNFTYELNSTAPPAQTVTAISTAVAANATTGQMPITVAVSSSAQSWLTVDPPSGVTSSQLTTGMPLSIAVNGAGLAPGKYTGTVTITGNGAGNAPQTITVNLTVANDPSIVPNNPALTFEFQIGQSAVAASQLSQTLTLASSNGATLNFSTAATTNNGGSGWLTLSGNTVSVNPAGLTAGTYTGQVTVTATNPATGNAAINSPLTIPVTFYVSNNPLLVPVLPGNPPAPPTFTAQVNGNAPAAQNITLLSSAPGTALTYNVTFTTANGGNNWLFVAPQSGSTANGANVVTISVLPGLLSPGTYTGTVSIVASGPGGTTVPDATAANPLTIPVTFQVTAGNLVLSPTSLTFSQVAGGSAPASQPVQVTSSTGTALNFSAVASENSGTSVNWLTVTPASGATGSSVTVSAAAGTLLPGTYTGQVTFTSSNAATVTLPVTFTVAAGTIAATPTTLTFTQTAGGPAPQSQTISVTSTPAPVNFTVTATANNSGTWLTATPAAGTTPGSVTVSANAGTLGVGSYTGTVTIASQNATGSPIAVSVTLNVVAPQTLTVTPTGALTFNYVIGASAPATQGLSLTSSGSAPFTATASTTSCGNGWLTVTPTSGTATASPTVMTVSVNTASLTTAGNCSGAITIASPNAAQPLTIPVNLSVVAIPAPVFLKVANAASYIANAISPGELIIIGGTGVGPAGAPVFGTVSNNSLSTLVSGTQVFFDATPAPIYYASATQTAVFVPYDVAGRPTTNITVKFQGLTSNSLTYTVVPAVPGIFTQNSQGSGPGSILNQDNSINGPNNGESAGRVVQVFGTGEGQISPAGVTGAVICPTGQVCTISQIPTPLLPVTATIGGVAAQVTFAGEAPGDVSGVLQVDVVVPAGVPAGPQPIVINIGGNQTQTGVTVQVK